MKVFIINLERSVRRRENILKELESHDLDFHFISAVDGAELTEDELSCFEIAENVRNWPEYYTKSVIGAALSHIKVYQQIIRDGIDVALVLEDDAVLAKDFKLILTKIGSLISTNEIVLLNYMSDRPVSLSISQPHDLFNGFGMYFPADFTGVGSGAGYIVTQAAARSLIKTVVPIRSEADCWDQFYQMGSFESIRFVYPMPVTTRGEKSTIAVDHQSTLRATVTGLIDQYKIPPFYQILTHARVSSIKARSRVKFVQNHLNSDGSPRR